MYLHLQSTPTSVIKSKEVAELSSLSRHPAVSDKAPQFGANPLRVNHIDPRVGARVKTGQENDNNICCVWWWVKCGQKREIDTQIENKCVRETRDERHKQYE